MKELWRTVRPYILSSLVYWAARFIGMSSRLKTLGYEPFKELLGGKIYAGWHGKTLIAANFWKDKGVWTIISHSRDGEMQNRIFKKFGFQTIRGSTGRGGAQALVEAIKLLRAGSTLAFTPDGPRGPSGVVQSGVIKMAQKSGAAIIPVGVSAKRRWLAPSWDRYMVPAPFNQMVMVFGEPIYVAADSTEEELEKGRLQLEEALYRLQAQADQSFGHEPYPCRETNSLTPRSSPETQHI